jgi:hypothetical protein
MNWYPTSGSDRTCVISDIEIHVDAVENFRETFDLATRFSATGQPDERATTF